ncbi:hypothetical protein [Klebsiella oxytoca]|uniref:hypothetical protein n=1 Tax=Klebsiella oxytoca TaxID=571 RepID=UPI00190EBBE5|nr:hypothetical protein [Klebsiella oxytoca]
MSDKTHSYHVITDNLYLGFGIRAVLEDMVGGKYECHVSPLDGRITPGGARDLVLRHKVSLTLLAVRCIQLRRLILRLLGERQEKVLVMSPPALFRKGQEWRYVRNIVIIPMNISINVLRWSVFSAGRKKSSVIVTAQERRLIDEQYHGFSDETLSQILGCSVRNISRARNRIMSRIGGLRGIHGFLLCRDIVSVYGRERSSADRADL